MTPPCSLRHPRCAQAFLDRNAPRWFPGHLFTLDRIEERREGLSKPRSLRYLCFDRSKPSTPFIVFRLFERSQEKKQISILKSLHRRGFPTVRDLIPLPLPNNRGILIYEEIPGSVLRSLLIRSSSQSLLPILSSSARIAARLHDTFGVTHGDFTSANLIIPRRGSVAIIDFDASLKIHNPARDIACFFCDLYDLFAWGYLSLKKTRVFGTCWWKAYHHHATPPRSSLILQYIKIRSCDVMNLEFYPEILKQRTKRTRCAYARWIRFLNNPQSFFIFLS